PINTRATTSSSLKASGDVGTSAGFTIHTLRKDGVLTTTKVTNQDASLKKKKQMRRPCNRFAPASSILLEEAHMDKGFDSRLERSWWILRIGLGIGPFLAGLDKYFNLLTNWTGYLSPLALKVLPFSGRTFMHIVGVIEMIVGLAILTKWTRV